MPVDLKSPTDHTRELLLGSFLWRLNGIFLRIPRKWKKLDKKDYSLLHPLDGIGGIREVDLDLLNMK